MYGLITYIALLAWFPSYLTVSVGTIDFTVRRILILAIFVRLLAQPNLTRQFRVILLDKFVVVYFVAQILVGVTASDTVSFFINRAGAFLDMILPYFAVRMIITTKDKYLALLKSVLIIAAPLAIVGFYQCLTGDNPFGFLKRYYAWAADDSYIPIRRGRFFRADVTFSVSIMFGLFFAMLMPCCVGVLRTLRKGRIFCWAGLGLMGLGVFSSMSSGPMLAFFLSVTFIALYHYRRYWKLAAILAVMLCLSVEIISNRHFYDVLGGFTLNPATAWYRSKLIDVALLEGGMSGHWIMGYLGSDVNPNWGGMIDGRPIDIVNHYICVLYMYGLAGLIPFLAMIITAAKSLIQAFRISLSHEDKLLIWCLAAAFFAIVMTLSTVSLFGPPTSIFYMVLGFCGVIPVVVKTANLQIRAQHYRLFSSYPENKLGTTGTGELDELKMYI
jgi:hypothetical protein